MQPFHSWLTLSSCFAGRVQFTSIDSWWTRCNGDVISLRQSNKFYENIFPFGAKVSEADRWPRAITYFRFPYLCLPIYIICLFVCKRYVRCNNRDRQPRVVTAVIVVVRLLLMAPHNVNLLWLHYAAHTGGLGAAVGRREDNCIYIHRCEGAHCFELYEALLLNLRVAKTDAALLRVCWGHRHKHQPSERHSPTRQRVHVRK